MLPRLLAVLLVCVSLLALALPASASLVLPGPADELAAPEPACVPGGLLILPAAAPHEAETFVCGGLFGGRALAAARPVAAALAAPVRFFRERRPIRTFARRLFGGG